MKAFNKKKKPKHSYKLRRGDYYWWNNRKNIKKIRKVKKALPVIEKETNKIIKFVSIIFNRIKEVL